MLFKEVPFQYSLKKKINQGQEQAKMHIDKVPWRIPVTDKQFTFILVTHNIHSAYVPYIHI